ncbi:MAG: hypothetical protein K2N05_09645 [Muribaculaceae bacterium]|nr:hypothetical protein [Muribaculaceae bacterium]
MKTRILSKFKEGLLLGAVILSFTACGNDDEPKIEDSFTTEFTYTAEFSEDLLATADVKAYILSPEGTVSEETITKAKNTWTLKGNSIPDKSGVRFDFDAKANLPENNYAIGYKCSTTVKCLNNGEVFSYKSENSAHSYTVPSQHLASFFGTSLILAGEISKDGEAKIIDGSDIDFGLNGTTPRPPFGSGGTE